MNDPAINAVLDALESHDLNRYNIIIHTGLEAKDIERALRLLIAVGVVKVTGGTMTSGERYALDRSCTFQLPNHNHMPLHQ